MTLKEQFLPFVDDIDLINDIPNEEWGLRNANKCVEIAEEFAIEFSKYVLSQIYNMTHGNKAGISIEKLLEIYKKEKGL